MRWLSRPSGWEADSTLLLAGDVSGFRMLVLAVTVASPGMVEGGARTSLSAAPRPRGGEAGVVELMVELLAAGQRAAARGGPEQQVVVGGGQRAPREQGGEQQRAARGQQPAEAAQQVGALVLGEVVDVLEQQHQVEGGRF